MGQSKPTKIKKAMARPIIAIIINVLIVASFVIGTLFNMLWTKQPDFYSFLYFSFFSSALIAISSLIFIVYTFVYLFTSINPSKWAFGVRLSCTGMALFVLVVFNCLFVMSLYIQEASFIPIRYETYNIFFMIVVPGLTIISFMFFEHCNSLKFQHTFWSLIPISIYLIVYIILCLINMDSDQLISYKIDFYLLFYYGGEHVPLISLGFLAYQYISTCILYTINRKFRQWAHVVNLNKI